MVRWILTILLILFVLPACLPGIGNGLTQPRPASDTPPHWWRDAVFYEIFVRSFYDTDNDGIGDFNGITEKLDYIQELGITAIWLMPINPSPSYHGYDIINYFAVNHEYGTMDDFRNLLEEAHNRDIRIIIDLVINHTSAMHPFFIDANRNIDSSYRNWYIWSDKWEGSGWHQGYHGYYYGLFWDGMPDLNYNNPEVTAFMNRVTEYWLTDIGVDGFRVDAAKHLIEQDGQTENSPATHDWYKDFFTTYKANHPDVYTVGEVFGAGAFIATTYENQLDQIFNFELASGFMNSVNGESNSGVYSAWKFTLAEIEDGDYATFLTNHDQNRVKSVLSGNEEKAKLAAFLLLSSPGTPFIYYGEEIGMQGKKPDEDIRLPMQWSAEVNAGFSGIKPWRSPNTDYSMFNVALQEGVQDSLLETYRELIHLRLSHPALRTGSLTLVETGNSGVYSILRSKGDEYLLIVANLTDESISNYSLDLRNTGMENGTSTPKTLFGLTHEEPRAPTSISPSAYQPLERLPPFKAYIFQLK
jgi:glycosidase